MSDVLYIPELAHKLGTTEAAIRGHIKRRTNAIPPWFYRGTRIAWRPETVDKWLIEQEENALRDRAVRPARRRLGGNNASTS